MTKINDKKYKIEFTWDEIQLMIGLCTHKLDYGGTPLQMRKVLAIHDKLNKINFKEKCK